MGDEVSAADFVAFPFVKYAAIPMQPGDPEPFHKVLDDQQQLGGAALPGAGLDPGIDGPRD